MLNKLYKKLILSIVCVLCLSFVDGARVYLSGDQSNMFYNCENSIDVMIDPQGDEIFGAVINMNYDWKSIEIIGFYPNEEFNLPVYTKDENHGGAGLLQVSMLSLNRDTNFKHIGFDQTVKFGTLVIKNKSYVDGFDIGFVEGVSDLTMENMSVFDMLVNDVLDQTESKSFDFVEGTCLHSSPDGVNHIDPDYNLEESLNKNLDNISSLEKKYTYKQMVFAYLPYGIMFVLLVILLIVVLKRKKSKDLKNKTNKND